MKLKVCIFLLLAIAVKGFSQFSPMPLNFPDANCHTWFLSAIDTGKVWVGADYVTSQGYLNYPRAITTSDGGNTWNFSTIPETGVVSIFEVFGVNAAQCYYVTNNTSVSAIWRTKNGGNSWENITPNQFIGGWANFYFGATADTGIAGGDPANGYWEIQLTADGGNTWTRVPSANIPAPLNMEFGIGHGYSAFGNHIWFSTSKGRCFHSADKGHHWTVSQVPGTWSHPFVTFVDSLRGVFYDQSPWFPSFKSITYNFNVYYMTLDGGQTWTEKTMGAQYFFRNFSKVPGTESAMVIGTYDSTNNYKATIFFTPDFLDQTVVIQSGISSTGEMSFINSTSGWLAGPGSQSNNIYKFSGDLWSFVGIQTKADHNEMQVYPSPAKDFLTVTVSRFSANDRLTVMDLFGRVVFTQPILASKTKIDISELGRGVYFVKAGKQVRKIVKE
jgi:hypothetical protein